MESIYKSLVKKYQIYLKLLIISFTIASGSFFSSVFFILTLVQWFIGAILNIQMDACWVIALPWMYRFCALWILLSLVLISVYYSTYGVRKRINFQEISFYAPRLLKLVFWAIITGFLISYVIISVLHFPKEATLLSSLFNEEKKLIDWMLFVSIEGCILTVSIFLLFCKNIVRNSDITPFGTNKKQNKLFELGLEYSAYYKFWANALFTAGIMTVAFYSILWPFFGDFILSVLVNEFPNWLQRIMSRSEWQSLDTVQKQIGFIGANIIILLGNLGILILLPMYFFTKISFLMHVKMQLRDRKYQIVGLVNKNSTDLALIVGIVSVITSSMLHYRLEPFFYEGFLKDLYNMIYIYFVSPTIFALALKSRIFGYVMVERYSKKIHNPTWIGYIVLSVFLYSIISVLPNKKWFFHLTYYIMVLLIVI